MNYNYNYRPQMIPRRNPQFPNPSMRYNTRGTAQPRAPPDNNSNMMIGGGILLILLLMYFMSSGSSSKKAEAEEEEEEAEAEDEADTQVSSTTVSDDTSSKELQSETVAEPSAPSGEVQCIHTISENYYSKLGDCSLSTGSDPDTQPWELTMDADSTCSPICKDGEILNTKLICKIDGEIDNKTGLCVSDDIDISGLFSGFMNSENHVVTLATDETGETTGIMVSIPTPPPSCRTRDELSLGNGLQFTEYLNTSGAVASNGIQVKVDDVYIPCNIIEENCNVCDTDESKNTCLCEYKGDIENNSCSTLESSVATCPS